MYWDVFVSLLLLFVCFVVPLRLALNLDVTTDEHGNILKDDLSPLSHVINKWEITMYIIDGFFFIDLIACFFTTIEDRERMQEVTDLKAICKDYLSGWFWVDILSIIPFDKIFFFFFMEMGGSSGGTKVNSLIRALKIGKIYKLIRLVRIIKLLKVMKTK
jgi:hypothetical protein